MRDVKDVVADFYKIIDEMTDISDNWNNKLSKAYLAQEDILHYLEFGNPNAVEMVKLTKKLIEVREERRRIKDCRIAVNRLVSGSYLQELKDKRESFMNPQRHKRYQYKTNVVKEAIGEQKELTSL